MKRICSFFIIAILLSGCTSKDEYESLREHDKNNNKIIDEYEDYINSVVTGDDLASQDLKYILELYAINFYKIIDSKDLDKRKALRFKALFRIYNSCILFISKKRQKLKEYELISEFNTLQHRLVSHKLVVDREIYKKYAIYNGFFHGESSDPWATECKLKLKAKYD